MGIRRLPLCAALALLLWSCDEGRIYDTYMPVETEGRTVRVRGNLSGAGSWPAGYSVAVAAFRTGEEYALVSKIVPAEGDGACDVVMSDIPADASNVELCAIDRLRRRVATFATVDCDGVSDTLHIDFESIDASPAAALQREVFNTTCINCHGGSTHEAAGLNLTGGRSFAALVGRRSAKKPDMLLIEPGNSGKSVLWRILTTDESSLWNYDHSVELVEGPRRELLRDWIDDGAKY